MVSVALQLVFSFTKWYFRFINALINVTKSH